MKLQITFSTDPTGLAKDVTETITIIPNVCLYCLHDKNINRFEENIKILLKEKGYKVEYYFQIMKVYSI